MSHQTFLNREVIQSVFSDHDMAFLQNGGTDSIQSKKTLPPGDLCRNWSSDSKMYLKVQKIWHNQNNFEKSRTKCKHLSYLTPGITIELQKFR